MRYACGWPDPRRSAPAQQVWVESVEDHLGSVPATAEATAMEREIGDAFVDFVAKRLDDKTRPGFVGAVIRLVVEGHDASSASKAIFGDEDARRVYRLADEYEAEHAIKRVVRKAMTMTDAFVSRRPRFRVAESSPS
jgi:pantothenate synthetase